MNAKLRDGLFFFDEDHKTKVVFNHYSFCELINWTIVEYAPKTYEEAESLVANSYLIHEPQSYDDVTFITQEIEFHWAMLITHGNMYWLKGISSDTNKFADEYTEWRNQIMKKHNLLEPYDFSDI